MGHGMVFEEKERIEQPHPRLYFSYRFAFMRAPSDHLFSYRLLTGPASTNQHMQPNPALALK